MTHDSALDRLLDTLSAGPSEQLPERVLDQVFVTTRGSRSLPRWLAFLKEPPMRLSNRVAVGSPTVRLAVMAATVILLAVALAGAVIAGSSPSPSEPPSPSSLVTEAVEPGVERIRSDGVGHDLEAGHPSFRYDMDGVFVAPDGTVWLNTSYRDSDNDANPPGGLVWALGQPETSQFASDHICIRGTFQDEKATGVTCLNVADGSFTETRYLLDTTITAISGAPDGTFWAVGSDGNESGGLYHITPE